MTRTFRNIAILIFPFVLMITINELERPKIKEKPYANSRVKAINSSEILSDKCTWHCHGNTKYCKKHHVKFLKPFYLITDVFYFGVISVLASTGNYSAANIFILVLLIPLTIWFLVVRSLEMQEEIDRIKRNGLSD